MTFNGNRRSTRFVVTLAAASVALAVAGCSPEGGAPATPETHAAWPASADSTATFGAERWTIESGSPAQYVLAGRSDRSGGDVLRVVLSRTSGGALHASFEQPERAALEIGLDGRVSGGASIFARAALSQSFADLATAAAPEAAETAGLSTRTALVAKGTPLLSSQCLSEDAANALGTASQCLDGTPEGSAPSETCARLAGVGSQKGVCVASLYTLVGKLARVNADCVFAAVTGAAVNAVNFEATTLACGWTVEGGPAPVLACGWAVGDIVEKTFKLKASCKVAFHADQNTCAKAVCDPVGTLIETAVSQLDTKPASVAGEKCVVEDKCDDRGNGAITCYQLSKTGKVTSTRYRKC